jgi:hypothetical protein
MLTPSPTSDLSTGTKVAISVVVPLFVLAVVGLAVFAWKRRQGTSQTQPTSSDAEAISEYHKAELTAEGDNKEPARAGVSGSGIETGYATANVQDLVTDGGVEHGSEQHEKP